MPHQLNKLPLSEFQVMYRYWMKQVWLNDPDNHTSYEPKDGHVIE
jgi:hypothetical protein